MKVYFPILLLLVSLAAAAQGNNTAYDLMLKGLLSHTVPTVSADSLGSLPNYILLDSRERPEYSVSHLDGARWVGYDTFNYKVVNDLPKDTTVVIYCSVGYRSEKIGEQLAAMGYTNVYNLYGGIFEWVNTDKPVVDTNNEPTDKVHAYNRAWGVWLEKGQKVYK